MKCFLIRRSSKYQLHKITAQIFLFYLKPVQFYIENFHTLIISFVLLNIKTVFFIMIVISTNKYNWTSVKILTITVSKGLFTLFYQSLKLPIRFCEEEVHWGLLRLSRINPSILKDISKGSAEILTSIEKKKKCLTLLQKTQSNSANRIYFLLAITSRSRKLKLGNRRIC